MEKKLTEELAKTGLPERSQLILALAPGCLFGFPPDNLGEIIERVDCPTCHEMMETIQKISVVVSSLQASINDLVLPVRKRNEARTKDYERRRHGFFIGLFAKLPELESEPEYLNQPWFMEAMRHVEEMERTLKALCEKDISHWGDERSRKTSREVVGLFLAKDNSYVLSI